MTKVQSLVRWTRANKASLKAVCPSERLRLFVYGGSSLLQKVFWGTQCPVLALVSELKLPSSTVRLCSSWGIPYLTQCFPNIESELKFVKDEGITESHSHLIRYGDIYEKIVCTKRLLHFYIYPKSPMNCNCSAFWEAAMMAPLA